MRNLDLIKQKLSEGGCLVDEYDTDFDKIDKKDMDMILNNLLKGTKELIVKIEGVPYVAFIDEYLDIEGKPCEYCFSVCTMENYLKGWY